MLKKTYLHSGFVKGDFPQKLAAAGFPGVSVLFFLAAPHGIFPDQGSKTVPPAFEA